jgi:hypothetical protein
MPLDGEIRGMYIMGENPAMSDPDANHAREALAKLDWLVVQEIFLTETCYHADVILPATAWPGEGRHGHQHRPHGADRPQGAGCAGRGEAGSVDHPGAGAASRPRLELQRAEGRVQRDAQGDELHRGHHLGAAGSRELRHLSLREGRRSRATRCFH